MSSAAYDMMWRETIAELDEQVHIEDNTLDVKEGDVAVPPPQASLVEAFQHFACLYIKYLQIMRRLERCYDAMLHPQKRIDIKMVLELVIRRVLELKHELVKWNPPNADMRLPPPAPEECFPWEYVNLDDILVDLKLPPETLDVPVPRYFKEDSEAEIAARDRLVAGVMKLRLESDGVYVGDEDDADGYVEEMTLEEAIEVLQRNERGRQGKQRAVLVRQMRDAERRRRAYDAADKVDMEPEIAAANIQRLFRGSAARRRAAEERERELEYIGMKPASVAPPGDRRNGGGGGGGGIPSTAELEMELGLAYRKRKQEQEDNKEGYERALDELQAVVMEEEGPEMRERLRMERTDWVTDQIAQDKFPEDLEAFYAARNAPPPPAEEENPESKAGGKGGKGGKKGGGKEAKESKDKDKAGMGGKKGGGKKGGKGGKAEDAAPPEQPPPLQGRSDLTTAMFGAVNHYRDVWEDRDEADNFAQKHDVALGKEKVRPTVDEQIRLQVDEMLLMNLKKIKLQVTRQEKKAKGKKGAKKGKKAKKAKGGKKGKGKGKGLPGDKITELRGMDTDQMLSALVESRVVNFYRPVYIADMIGDFNYLGTIHQHTERRDGEWAPQDPSMAQLRQLVTEYCILPVGSRALKESIKPEHQIKSVLLYGPSGSGKTSMVEAVAHETGALLLNLSPSRVRGLFPGKGGATKLVHMALAVARDKAMAPVVIYIDECEQVFAAGSGGKKSKAADKDSPARLKKDLMLYKTQALLPEDRVIIIGCTSRPDAADPKDLRSFFQKFLYLPAPDYPSRLMLWQHCISRQYELAEEEKEAASGVKPRSIAGGWAGPGGPVAWGPKVVRPRPGLDATTLAHVSEGYSAGAIVAAATMVLTQRRVARAARRPVAPAELLAAMATHPVLLKKDARAFQDFTAKITGLEERRKKVREARAALVAGKGDEKKGVAKKKK